jgi:hypothetical protein
MVGLHRVGVVGLHKAIQAAVDANLGDRQEIVSFLVDRLRADNYIPESQLEAFRIAVWREYLRHLGEPIEEFFSEITVTVCGEAGEELERFVELTESVLASHELRPTIEYGAVRDEGEHPQLIIADQVIVQGLKSREHFSTSVRKTLSHW